MAVADTGEFRNRDDRLDSACWRCPMSTAQFALVLPYCTRGMGMSGRQRNNTKSYRIDHNLIPIIQQAEERSSIIGE